jgi:hypothetical protein
MSNVVKKVKSVSSSSITQQLGNQMNTISETLLKVLDLSIQSYLLIFVTIVTVLIAVLNQNIDKKVPVVIIINAAIGIYIIECLIAGGCSTITWFFIVFNAVMMLGLCGIFKTEMSFKVDTMLIDVAKMEKNKENNKDTDNSNKTN